MTPSVDRLRQSFLEEATEHLTDLEQGLLLLEAGPADPDLLNRLFRAAHSIKGGSGLFDLGRLTRLTHALEHVLGRMRSGQLVAEGAVVDLLLRAADALKGMLQAAQVGGADGVDLDPLLADLAERVGAPPTLPAAAAVAPPAGAPRKATYRGRFNPSADLLRDGNEPLLLLRNLSKRCEQWSASVDLTHLPPLEALDPETCYLTWDLAFMSEAPRDELEGVFGFLDGRSEVSFTEVATAPRLGALTALLVEQTRLLETVRAAWVALTCGRKKSPGSPAESAIHRSAKAPAGGDMVSPGA